MHDVIAIQKHAGVHLVCGTRIHERLAGLGIAVAVSPLVIRLGQILAGGDTHVLASLVFVCLVVLFGLHLLLSTRRFIFAAHSQTCMVHIKVLGVLRWRQEIEFSHVAVRRRYDWCLPRWLRQLVLVNPSQTHRRGFVMGYVAGRGHAETLAQTIAEFTDTTALDLAGQPLH